MREYEFYKIEHGKIHIFDIKDRQNDSWDDKYMCGQFKIGRDEELNFNPQLIGIQRDKICKRCFKKFTKTNPIVLPDELFEI